MSSRLSRLLLCPALALLAACSGPSIPVPPTPTIDPSAVNTASSHQHGAGEFAGRLVTKYGGPVAVTVATQPDPPEPNAPLTVTYALRDGSGSPVTSDKLLLTHERLMHMFIVSEDLGYFAHVHPSDEGGGRYSVTNTLPSPGRYVLFNNFVGLDGNTQTERNVVSTVEAPTAAAPATLAPDLGTSRQVDGLTVTMKANASKVRRRVPTTFTLSVQKDGRPVTDLEPYLGAACHVVAISADARQFVHTHGDVEGGAMAGDMGTMAGTAMVMPTPPARFGPNLQFTHTFMQPGMHRVWVQFKRGGAVMTVAYNVQVNK